MTQSMDLTKGVYDARGKLLIQNEADRYRKTFLVTKNGSQYTFPKKIEL